MLVLTEAKKETIIRTFASLLKNLLTIEIKYGNIRQYTNRYKS